MRVLAFTTVVLAGVTASATSQAPCEVFRLENPIAPVDGTFGQAVAFDGNRMLIGMPSQSTSPSYGSAYVFERSAAGWALTAVLASPEPEQSDYYGWAVALDGDVALVTKRRDGTLGAKGAVFAFHRQPTGQWVATQKLAVDDVECWAFGWSMELEGTRAAIAAKGAGSVGPKGRVFIFELEDGLFVEKAKIKPSLDNLGDWFGASVALDGDRLAVGAPKSGTGRAYVFDRQPDGTWVEEALLLPADLASADQYGHAVAIDGDRVAVSAPVHDLPYGNGGAVYVYELTDEVWTQSAKLSTPPTGSLAFFGSAMSLRGDELVVTASMNSTAASAAGAAYVFRLVDGVWQETAKFFGSDPHFSASFGHALARDGDDLAIGAPAMSTPGPGRVHVFSFDGGAHLGGDTAWVSMSSGGAQALQLGACPEHAGDFYFLLGTASGIAPPLPLGGALLPLVLDAYLAFTLESPNNPILQASLGVLDPWGRGEATFALPPGAVAAGVGMMLHHAYVVLDASTLEVELASNATPVRLVP